MGGCTASKLSNEDTVRRCKDRCQLMKEAVYARHHLAAAHADYCRSLRVTGSALVSFSAGESFFVSDETPAVFLRTPSSASPKPPPPPSVRIPSPSPSIRQPQPSPPPPLQQHFARSPSPSVARSFASQRHQQLPLPLPRRKKPAMKLPHILSDSSYPTTPTTHNFVRNQYAGGGVNSPSQASSAWNWENFEPPPPPPSEYFEQLQKNRPAAHVTSHPHDDSKSSSFSELHPSSKQYDFFDNQSVINDENASVHSSYSHHSSKGYFHDRDQIPGQNHRHHPQDLRKFRNQDPIPQRPNHLQQRSESGRGESKYSINDENASVHSSYSHHSKNGYFRDRDQIPVQIHRYHPPDLRKVRDQDLNSQRTYHLHDRSESGREELKYSQRIFYSQDEVLQNHHLQEHSGSESEAETEEEEFHEDQNFQNRRHHQRGDFHTQGPIMRNNNVHHRHPGESEAEREEVQCSEWEDHDHYSTSSSTDEEDEEEEREEMRSETGSAQSKNWSNSKHHHHHSHQYSSVHRPGNEETGYDENRMVVQHRNLTEIAEEVKSFFDKAAQSGDQICEMLEAGREQLDRNFKQLKKTVYHSSGIMSSLSSLWSSKPPLAIKYKLEPPLSLNNEPSSGGHKSLRSTLDKLLAWEKKLYGEVKAREGAKIEHEKRLATLQSLEYRGGDVAKVDKTKAAINRLQCLIEVTSGAVSTTSSAIIGLRESDLVPHLVDLCHGFMCMWRSMNKFHDAQNQVVQQVKGLVNRAARQSTTDLHRQSTRDLESAMSAWHSAFSRIVKFQRDFVRSLHGWFKLTLLPVEGAPEVPVVAGPTQASMFCEEWKLALDRAPDTVASEALKSFTNVVRSISAKQTEEAKIKKRTESISKEFEKKEASIRSLERKFYNSSAAGLDHVGPTEDDESRGGLALDTRDPLAEKKAELLSYRRRVEDEMARHVRATEVTRAMTLNNIQSGLPPVFQAMTSFSALFTEALEVVCAPYSISN